jgi:hypothetical protein
MSTRACYRFIPENGPNDFPGVVTVYKHRDGYPKGAARAIEAAIPYAFPLPRFEADEFAAAFVRANKKNADDYARDYEISATETADPEKKAVCLSVAEHYRSEKAYRESVQGGEVRLVPFEGLDAYQRFAGDIAYLYDIRCVAGKLRVSAYTPSERDGVSTVEKFFEGSTKDLARRKAP